MRTRKFVRGGDSLPRRSRQRGSALVLALVSVVTVAALTTAFLQLSTAVSRRQAHMRDKMQAFYMAEAGLAESWAAVQIRKTGNVGTAVEPAVFGDGLFWVQATDAGDDLLRLDSTGLVGTGRASLSLVVEKGKESIAAMGVYSSAPMTLPPGSFVDGYDSRLGYGENGAILPVLPPDLDGLLQDFSGQVDGLLGGGKGTRGASAQLGGLLGDTLGGVGGLLEDTLGEVLGEGQSPFSGRIASGGAITVSGTPTLPTTIQGDLVPGPGAGVTVTGNVEVGGTTEAAGAPASLPRIEVPALPVSAPINHTKRIPRILLPADTAYQYLAVATNSELIIQGPATVVVGTLRLAANAHLYVDTTDGPVSIYVTTSVEVSPNARITNSSEDPADLALNITTAPEGAITLPCGRPLRAVVYAPDAKLALGAGFQFFGSLVAKAITFGGPPKLHFDEHLVEVAEEATKPRLLSWRILELSNDIALVSNPFDRLGLDPAALPAPADAHAPQPISVVFNNGGGPLSYDGMEDGFDWGAVQEVKSLTRGGAVVVGNGVRPGADDTAPIDGLLQSILDLVANTALSSAQLATQLVARSPLSRESIQAAIHRQPPLDSPDIRAVMLANLPLSDSLLRGAANSGRMTSGDLSAVLLAQSPGLATSVMTAAAGALTPAHLAALIAAQ